MFGILYSLGLATMATASGIKAAKENFECISRGEERATKGENFAGIYYDRKGVMRDLKTHKIADIRRDYKEICDDCYLWIGTPGVKTRNLSAEKRKNEFEKGRNGDWLGQTTDLYDKREWSTYSGNKNKVIIHGAYYIDLLNEKIYVCREFPLAFNNKDKTFCLWQDINYEIKYSKNLRCGFYMDVQSGLLIRKSDSQIKNEEKIDDNYKLTAEETELFIQQFNLSQKNGGWYHSRSINYNEIKEKQDYFCDDFVCYDHIYKLIERR